MWYKSKSRKYFTQIRKNSDDIWAFYFIPPTTLLANWLGGGGGKRDEPPLLGPYNRLAPSPFGFIPHLENLGSATAIMSSNIFVHPMTELPNAYLHLCVYYKYVWTFLFGFYSSTSTSLDIDPQVIAFYYYDKETADLITLRKKLQHSPSRRILSLDKSSSQKDEWQNHGQRL